MNGSSGGDTAAAMRTASTSLATTASREEDSSESGNGHQRASSLESRAIDAYYRHLERYKVPRTKSWVTLQPHKVQFNQKPVILKPLKLIRPASRNVNSVRYWL